MTKEEIKNRIKRAIGDCPYRLQIKSVALFGSFLAGTASAGSDVDILVDFRPNSGIGFFEFYDIQQVLEKTLGIHVDLLTPQSLSK